MMETSRLGPCDMQRLAEMVEQDSAGVPVDRAHIVQLAKRLAQQNTDMREALDLIRERMGAAE